MRRRRVAVHAWQCMCMCVPGFVRLALLPLEAWSAAPDVCFLHAAWRCGLQAQLSRAQQERRWRLAVAAGLLVGPFFPASNVLFYVGTFIGERLLYFPSGKHAPGLLMGRKWRRGQAGDAAHDGGSEHLVWRVMAD